jgi:hypothetical protein
MIRSDFCVFILTHGRPDKVYTVKSLELAGYTGPYFLVIDDEDKTADQYRAIYGAKVLQFSKAEAAKAFDEADNFDDRRAIVYARNTCRRLAEEQGFKYYAQLDDDYTGFEYRVNDRLDYQYMQIKLTLDQLFNSLIDFLESTPVLTIAISQGGDHIGGGGNVQPIRLRRKAMNSFICSVDKPLDFVGRVNEDVNTYTSKGRAGSLFFTVMQAMLRQKQTQSSSGGMTEMYLDSGTYVKSFYSVMFAPSCVKVGAMGDPRGGNYRLHHVIDWETTAPRIVRQDVKKPRV